jgi:drug/metabolite transporter (DMT)-like permease
LPNWLLFLVPSLIWGTTWLTIKFQLGVVTPEVSVAYRFGLASLVLFTWCLARSVPLRFDARTHASFALLGVLQYGFGYVLVYLSEGYLPSGVVAVVFVLMVAWNLVGARVFFASPLSLPVLAGAGLGMAGVTLVFSSELSHVAAAPGQVRGVVLAVLATMAQSAGNLWSQRLYTRGMAIPPSTAFAMLYASMAVALYCLLRGLPFRFDTSPAYLASLVYLAVFGSVLAFIGFLTLLQRIGVGRAGYTSAVIPVLAMATSTVFEGYRWSLVALSGMALVLAGNVMVLRGNQRAASVRQESATR